MVSVHGRVRRITTFLEGAIMKFLKDYRALRGAPRELWLAFAIKVLEGFAYFSMTIVLMLWLRSELGLSFEKAGWVYGLWGTLIGIYSMLIGALIDRIGVRKSLILGTGLMLASRGIMTFSSEPMWLWLAMLGLMPLGQALGIPVLATGIRRYTTTKTRSFGFSMFYACLNLGAVVGGVFIDYAGKWRQTGVDIDFVGWTIHLPIYRVIFFSAFIATGLSFGLAMLMREIKINEEGKLEKFIPGAQFKPSSSSLKARLLAWIRPLTDTAKEGRFWRFLLFLVLLIGVRATTRYLESVFPAYLKAELGSDVSFGKLVALNPVIVMILAPLLVPLVTRLGTYKAILYGSMISAAGVFILTAGASYWTAIAFVVVLSIGESIWSPRLNEYAVSIAPEGREGSYMSLATIPMFFSKTAVGGLAGYLLATYLPEKGTRSPETMWLIIGLMALASPVLIFVFRKIIMKNK